MTESKERCTCEHCGCNEKSEYNVVYTTIESADLMRTIGSVFDRYRRNVEKVR